MSKSEFNIESSAKKFAALIGTSKDQDAVPKRPYESSSREVDEGSDWRKANAIAQAWAKTGDSFFPVTEVVEMLPPGAYRCMFNNRGPYLEKMPINIDNLLHLPDSASDLLLSEFKKFWTLRENFASRGFTYKRGMLLWGPPGSGKTSAIWQMTKTLVQDQRGVVIFIDSPEVAKECMVVLRRVEPDRPIICVYEDIDALVDQYGEHGFLSMLDGENQTNEVMHVATTNYPEKLDRRFVDRPSRFDTIAEIGMPSAEARREYLRLKEPSLTLADLVRWTHRTDGYSIAHLREVIIAVKCFEQDEDDVFERLEIMREANLSSDGRGGARSLKVGFGARGG